MSARSATSLRPEPPPRPRVGHTLAWKLYLTTAAIVAAVLGGILVVLTILAGQTADAAIARGLEQTRQHVRALLDGRERSLASGALVFAQGPVFRSLVMDARPEDLRDQASEAVQRIGASWVQITDAAGVRLAKSDEPTARADTLAGSALIAGALAGEVATGFGVAGDSALVQTAAVPVTIGAGQTAGVLMAAQTIDTALARAIRDATASEVIFYLVERSGRARVAVSTVPDSSAVAILLARATVAAESGDSTPIGIDFGGQHFVGRSQPLLSAGGNALGGFIALRSREAEMAPFAALRRRIVLTGLLGLGAAFALSFALGRQIIRPLRAMADVTRRAAEGDYSADLDVRGDDEIGSLAAAMRSMLSDLHERRILSDYLSEPGADTTRESRAERARRDVARAVTASPDALQPGDVLAGRYRVLDVLGVGGNGVVYKATDSELGETVAVKTLRPGSLLYEPGALDRLRSEIRLARRISHRNVVRIHDIGESGGIHFITMEYIAGMPLNELIDRRAPISATATIAIAKQLCRALEVAHEQGVIHRDIKPQNIIVQPDGVLKVMDFGVARTMTRTVAMTESGMVVGTPAYMAPEQLIGDTVDARSDIFAAGVVLYECLTRRRPFDAATPQGLLGQLLSATPVPPHEIDPRVPTALSVLVLSTLARDPAARPQSATALRERITTLERAA